MTLMPASLFSISPEMCIGEPAPGVPQVVALPAFASVMNCVMSFTPEPRRGHRQQHLLAVVGRQLLGMDARHRVAVIPGRVGHDDGDRLRRPGLRRDRTGKEQSAGGRGGSCGLLLGLFGCTTKRFSKETLFNK